MIKWMPVAACLVLVMIGNILVPHFLRKEAAAEDKYKYHVSETERDIEWPWKYKTLVEKYPVVKFNGKQFTAKSQNSIHTEVMGEVIGSCVAEGVDSDTGKTYMETYEVRKIKGISEELMIAVGNEDRFYVYAADEEAAPDTLGKLLELYELSQNLELNYATKCESYEEKEELLLDNDEKIWQILYGCGNAKIDDTSDLFERENGEKDGLVSVKDTMEFFATAASKDRQMKIYGGLFYEILNEYCRDEVIADVIAWMNHRI